MGYLVDNVLYHSAKGTEWEDHKYIRIENGRYIYPEDLQSQARRTGAKTTNAVNDNPVAATGYKSKYYNPSGVQKNSRSTAALNDEGKIIWNDVKNNITEEKKKAI